MIYITSVDSESDLHTNLVFEMSSHLYITIYTTYDINMHSIRYDTSYTGLRCLPIYDINMHSIRYTTSYYTYILFLMYCVLFWLKPL